MKRKEWKEAESRYDGIVMTYIYDVAKNRIAPHWACEIRAWREQQWGRSIKGILSDGTYLLMSLEKGSGGCAGRDYS